MSIRSLAERFFTPFIFRRRLPSEFGGTRLYVCTRNAGLKFLRYRDLYKIDPSLLGIVGEFIKPGMTAWDIGANIGLFTFSAANRVGAKGSILAIDADIDNIRLLLRSRAALDVSSNGNVQILPAAVAGENMPFATFRIARRSRASNALAGFGASQSGGFLEDRTVAAFTLDQLAQFFPKPHFIKIDVEQAEVVVLQGASRLLAESRPIFCVEVASENRAAVAEIFKRHRYRFYNADSPRGQRVETLLPMDNTLAIPD